MTFVKKQNAGLLKSARSWGVLGLALALAVMFGSREITAQQPQTINLNTGLAGLAGTTLISFLQLDDDWRVTADPINTTVPRPAFVVNHIPQSGNLVWPAPFANSRWISAAANKHMGKLQPPRTPFTYRACFNLPILFSAPQLTIQLRADDIIRQVRLNSTTIFNDPNLNAAAGATKPGSHLGPLLSITYSQLTGFQGGQNCLEVVVEDVDQMITGLNVAVTVTYQPFVVQVLPVPCPKGLPAIDMDLSTGTTGNPPVDIAPGLQDPKWFLVSSPNQGQSPAFVTNSTWPILNTTQPANWIQRIQNVNAQSDAPGTYTYRVQFGLNTSLYNSIQLTLRYAADNAAVVRLNGTTVASCPGPNCFSGWQGPVTLTTGFLPVNSFDIVVTNSNPATGPSLTGLIVDARLRATCN